MSILNKFFNRRLCKTYKSLKSDKKLLPEIISERFWETKNLTQMNDAEWEAVCDGCGKCCYRKYLEGKGKNTTLIFTRIACDCLDLQNGKCSCYKNRFKVQKECTHLTRKNLKEFKWLPETCAYRLLSEGKKLYPWHPLLSGNTESLKQNNIMISNGIHEKDVDNWEDYIIKEQKFVH